MIAGLGHNNNVITQCDKTLQYFRNLREMQLRPIPVWGGGEVYPHALGLWLPQGLR